MGARVAAELATSRLQGDSFLLGVMCLSYPLHRPKCFSELRVSHVIHLGLPVLFISGTKDAMCRMDLMENVIYQMGGDVKVHWIHEADHMLNVNKHFDSDILEEICQWALEWCQSVFAAER